MTIEYANTNTTFTFVGCWPCKYCGMVRPFDLNLDDDAFVWCGDCGEWTKVNPDDKHFYQPVAEPED